MSLQDDLGWARIEIDRLTARVAELEAINSDLAIGALKDRMDLFARLEATTGALRKAADDLHEAAGDIEDWGLYASEYFQEKHDLAGTVAAYRAKAETLRQLGEQAGEGG